jgi:threonine/homoserine/homoserine lactone efflux protein
LPIILITVFFFNVLPPGLETVLTVGGALFVLYLAWEIVRDARHAHLVTGKVASNANAASDIWRGMMVNLLSPQPWLFWIGVAAPLLTRAWQTSAWSAAGFLVGFYGLLIGSKALVAVGVTGGRRFLNDQWYQRLLLASALLLAIFGVRLLWQAVGPIVG